MSALPPKADIQCGIQNVCFGRRIQLIDATPFPSNLARWNDMHMEGHARTWFTPKQKAELWERWKSGQCVADIETPPADVRFTPESGHSALLFARSHERARGSFLHPAQCLMPDTQSWKAVLTVVDAVYGGVNLSHLGTYRHGSIPYRARTDSRGWRCFFPIRD